jgi:hypothetical protein
VRRASAVAKRCVCVEITRQRAAIEGIDREDAETLRSHYPDLVEALDVEDALLDVEAKALDAPIGKLRSWDNLVGSTTLQCAVLLWALGKLERLPTVASVDDGSFVKDVGAASYLMIADIDVLRASLEMAELRPKEEILAAIDKAQRSLSERARLVQRGVAPSGKLEGTEAQKTKDLLGLGILSGLAWIVDPNRDY